MSADAMSAPAAAAAAIAAQQATSHMHHHGGDPYGVHQQAQSYGETVSTLASFNKHPRAPYVCSCVRAYVRALFYSHVVTRRRKSGRLCVVDFMLCVRMSVPMFVPPCRACSSDPVRRHPVGSTAQRSLQACQKPTCRLNAHVCMCTTQKVRNSMQGQANACALALVQG